MAPPRFRTAAAIFWSKASMASTHSMHAFMSAVWPTMSGLQMLTAMKLFAPAFSTSRTTTSVSSSSSTNGNFA